MDNQVSLHLDASGESPLTMSKDRSLRSLEASRHFLGAFATWRPEWELRWVWRAKRLCANIFDRGRIRSPAGPESGSRGRDMEGDDSKLTWLSMSWTLQGFTHSYVSLSLMDTELPWVLIENPRIKKIKRTAFHRSYCNVNFCSRTKPLLVRCSAGPVDRKLSTAEKVSAPLASCVIIWDQ